MFLPLLLVLTLLTGCAATYRARCSDLGWVEGTPDHAACSERERERVRAAVRDLGHQIQQQSYQQQMLRQQQQYRPRPVTCYTTPLGYQTLTQCY